MAGFCFVISDGIIPPNGGFFMLLPCMGDSYLDQLSDGMSIGANASISHTTKPRPMTTQLSAPALSDEQLQSLNGAGTGATLGWVFGNILTGGIPIIVDAATGGHVTRDAQNASF